MRRQFAEDAFVVVGLPLLVGLHVSGLEFDTVSVKLLSAFITTRLCLRGVRRVAEYSAMVIQPRDRSHRYG